MAWRDQGDVIRAQPNPFNLTPPRRCTVRRRLLLMGATTTVVSVEGQNGAGDWLLLYQGPVQLLPVPVPRVVTRLRIQTGAGTCFVQLQDDDQADPPPCC